MDARSGGSKRPEDEDVEPNVATAEDRALFVFIDAHGDSARLRLVASMAVVVLLFGK